MAPYDAGLERYTKPCECGHQRGAHADMYQRCDECSCQKYVGEIPRSTAANEYGPYGYVGPYIPDSEDEYEGIML
jgi:hypothetical protein